ncbi:hypothetical protein [Aeromicrobium wangtongii]|uniref:Uncharacterized protein n=1 Tax=Aeromicrobium wangtongii TaxID=2969247 RepID=A0ABY5MDF9_9ACTN|nr:hypothetical protein [Aeromicrobium wangtongii]MCD9197477.1 hypothetical protein [Aeromicrobium wangtongii]UUP14969.1 hypothetical protein NQV15_06570 [Aeromicrobium wangtongii]
MSLPTLRTPRPSTPRPQSYVVGADNDPIAQALEAGLGDAQDRNAPPENPFIPLEERQRRQVGPFIPHAWQEKLHAPVKPWHSLVDEEALTAAQDALLRAVGVAEEAADAVTSLRGEQRDARDEAVRAARAAAKAGQPLPEPTARDWQIEAAYRETQWREALKAAQKASAQYAATAKQIDPSRVIEIAEKQSAAKAKVLAEAQRVAAKVSQAVQVDRMLGDAAADLKLGPHWHVSDDEARELPGRATVGVAAAVRWLSSERHDVHAAITDRSTVLPMVTREWLAKQSENTFDFLARLEATEQYSYSRLTFAHADRYQNSVLYEEERQALAERRLPMR